MSAGPFERLIEMREFRVIFWVSVIAGVVFWPMLVVAAVAAVIDLIDGVFFSQANDV